MVLSPRASTAPPASRDPAGIGHRFEAEILRVILTVAVFSLAMLLPYLPGRYDASASAVSFLAQLASLAAAFLLAPVGVAWILNRTRSYLWFMLTLGLAAVMVCVLAIGAAAINQLALGLIIGAVGALLLLEARRLAVYDRDHTIKRAMRLPFYLITVPVGLLLFRAVVLPTAAEWSRNRAIQHSRPLIREIELFQERTGHYPVSLQSLNADVPTGVVGIERFLYEPHGASYNLFFIRPSIQMDAQEVSIFNPLDEHRFTAHELDLLQYEGDHLDRRRGDRRRTQLPHAHWVSILFD